MYWRLLLLPGHFLYAFYTRPSIRVSVELLVDLYRKGHLDGTATTHVRHGIIIPGSTLTSVLPETIIDSPSRYPANWSVMCALSDCT